MKLTTGHWTSLPISYINRTPLYSCKIGTRRLFPSSLIHETLRRVVLIASSHVNERIILKINKIEETLNQRFNQIEERLSLGQDTFLLIRDGLQAYKDRWAQDFQGAATNLSMHKLYEKIRNDKDLRFPHRKILDCLLGQFDFSTKDFKELNFSRLVKEARVGKNMAGSYLRLLEEKGYISVRDDGYRKWVRVKG